MRLLLLLLLMPGFFGCASQRVSQPAAIASADQQISALLQGADVSLGTFDAAGTSSFAIRSFSYKSRHYDVPYGYGFGVLDPRSQRLLWVHLIPGDYAPHNFRWTDFDGDDRQDIVLYFGEEEPVGTQVILNRRPTDGFALTNFAVGLSVDDAYAVVVEDPRSDLPNLLLPIEPRHHVNFGSQCLTDEGTQQLRELVPPEFRRLSGRFVSLNVGGSETDVAPDMFLFEMVQFVSLRDGWWNDMTERHLDHLRWRIATLQAVRATVIVECLGSLDRLICDLAQLERQASDVSR